MTRAPVGAVTLSAGPASAIRSPRTTTTQFSCGLALTPSKTRAGLSTTAAAALGFPPTGVGSIVLAGSGAASCLDDCWAQPNPTRLINKPAYANRDMGS